MNENRRNFLSKAGLGALGLALSPLAFSCSSQKKRPNLLFIFADDQTFRAIHALGTSELHTPNLDRLVKRGVTFTHANNQGGWHGAVCVASRTMLNTGRFLWYARELEPSLKEEAKRRRLWGQLLTDAGYETYMSGKWHVKVDAASVFQHTGHIRPGMPNQTPEGYDRPKKGEPDKWSPYDPKFGGYWKGGKHWSEVLRDEAEAFIKDAKNKPKPFFMYIAFNAPHDPRQSPKSYVDQYPLEKIKVPKNFLPEYPYKEDIGCGEKLRDEQLAPFPRTKYAVKVHRQEYYAIITHMDYQIGRILKTLEETGQADNTIIFFTADHGLAVGRHGLMGKQNLFDHSVRVPLIVSGPGIPRGKTIATHVYLQDVMPTTLELAGAAIPDYVQFKSLLPLIKGTKKKNYDAIYGGYRHLQRMVCQDDYKMIIYPKISKKLLFNLKDDPLEMHDLAGEPHYKAKMDSLLSTFYRLQKDTGDTLKIK